MGEVSNQKGNKYIGRKETLSGETQLIEVYPRVTALTQADLYISNLQWQTHMGRVLLNL